MEVYKNRKFEQLWSYLLQNVNNPEDYMKGEIKEACRTFHKIGTDYKGEWK